MSKTILRKNLGVNHYRSCWGVYRDMARLIFDAYCGGGKHYDIWMNGAHRCYGARPIDIARWSVQFIIEHQGIKEG